MLNNDKLYLQQRNNRKIMAENTQPTKSQRDKVRERVGSSRPDLNMDDEEAVYGAISEDYDNYDNIQKENEGYRKREQDFADFITSGEHNGEYWEGLANGKDLFEIAVSIHGRDNLLEYLQSEDAIKKYEAADQAYKDKLAKNKELEEASQKNLDETNTKLNQAVDEGRFSEDEATKAIEGLLDIADAIKLNICEPEWVEMWLKAQAYDHDVESARSEGRLDGINEGIDTQMSNRRARRGGSGPSMPVGAGGSSKDKGKAGGSIAEQLFNQ